MTTPSKPSLADQPVVVIDIGNTRTTVATWHNMQVRTPLSVTTGDVADLNEVFTAHARECPGSMPAATIIASVVPTALETVEAYIENRQQRRPLVVGEALPLPIDVAVRDPKAIGVDRVCAAAAAYNTLQTGCIIVDFGSAVTVDLVDDDGVLLGGAILPGLRMQLRALHDYTAVLPEVEVAVPDLPYGRDTREAIQTGVCRGVAGAVRGLVEGYATQIQRWPQVVATGGDVEFIAPHCDFLDSMVDQLTLRGIGLAYSTYLADKGA